MRACHGDFTSQATDRPTAVGRASEAFKPQIKSRAEIRAECNHAPLTRGTEEQKSGKLCLPYVQLLSDLANYIVE